jgi:membrane protease YdiL (CAAX protease family)
MTALAINSEEANRIRIAEGRAPRFGPMLMLFARPTSILLAQGITYLLFLVIDVPNASVAIRNWWPVYGTLADLGCLALLIWLTRREGIHLTDLIGLDFRKLKTEIPLGIGLFLLIFPVTIFGGGMLAQLISYGKINPEFPEYTFTHTLPLLALLYARILWWPIWSATEEMTYNGYALPRLLVQTKSRWISVITVAFFFSLQHSFLMLAGFQFGFYMFLTFLPLSIAMLLAYLRLRRLPPLIIAHWLMDLSNVLFLYQAG